MSKGSPGPSIGCSVLFRSNTFDSTTLNIFCTLMECDEEVKMRGARIAVAYLRASFSTSARSSGASPTNRSYFVPIRNGNAVCTKISRAKVSKQNSQIKCAIRSAADPVKAPSLAIPFLDAQ